MKKVFVLALAGCVGVASADTILQDFEAGANGALITSTYLPDYSGTSVGVDGTDDEAVFSNEQANGGAQSGKISWDWDGTAASGVVRVQPTAALNNNTAANRTAEPYVGLALYGSAQGDEFTLFMQDGGYEVFSDRDTISWSGWKIVERNITSSPVVAWITGDGALNANSCFLQGWWWYQLAPNGTRVTYYLDDIAFTSASRATAGVDNWSVY